MVMVSLVEWEVFTPAVQVIVNSTLNTVALAFLLKMTLLMGVLFMYFLKKLRKPDTG